MSHGYYHFTRISSSEIRLYNLDYQYGKDSWRKYLKSYKENIIRIEESEKDKNQRINNLIGDYQREIFASKIFDI